MLKDYLIPNLKKHKKFSTTIFQQDGATPHTALNTKEFLKREFGEDAVISRGFPFAWPGYSPDLTPADFGLWPHLKMKVCAKNYNSVEELKTAIQNEFHALPQCFFSNCVNSVIDRFPLCFEANSGNI